MFNWNMYSFSLVRNCSIKLLRCVEVLVYSDLTVHSGVIRRSDGW